MSCSKSINIKVLLLYMTNANEQTALTQKIYEFIKSRGCATIEEIAQAVNTSPRKAYMRMRTLFARRLVLPYRPHVGRERIYCIPVVGDKLYGRKTRANSSGIICITLPIDIIEAVDEIAVSTGRTRSSIIKQALLQLIDSYHNGDDQHEQPEDEQHESPEDEEIDLIVPNR
jgi:DNA-binding Lrp family transcriptional regulator